jgi:hypothetical protein
MAFHVRHPAIMTDMDSFKGRRAPGFQTDDSLACWSVRGVQSSNYIIITAPESLRIDFRQQQTHSRTGLNVSRATFSLLFSVSLYRLSFLLPNAKLGSPMSVSSWNPATRSTEYQISHVASVYRNGSIACELLRSK